MPLSTNLSEKNILRMCSQRVAKEQTMRALEKLIVHKKKSAGRTLSFGAHAASLTLGSKSTSIDTHCNYDCTELWPSRGRNCEFAHLQAQEPRGQRLPIPSADP